MTLVIATRGIDLSVGAIAAISGAVACTYMAGSPDESTAGRAIVAMTMAVGVAILLGVWNGFLVSVLGIQPIIATLVLMTAGRGLAMLITDGQITTVNNSLFKKVEHRLRAGPAGRDPDRPGGLRDHRGADPPHCARHADRGGRHQPRGEPARRRAGPHDHLDRVRLRGVLRRHRGPDDRVQHERGGRQQRGPVHRARRDPRRRHRRHVARRRPLLADRHADRCDVHPDPRDDDPDDRHPCRDQLPVQGRRGDRGLPAAVAQGARGAVRTTTASLLAKGAAA